MSISSFQPTAQLQTNAPQFAVVENIDKNELMKIAAFVKSLIEILGSQDFGSQDVRALEEFKGNIDMIIEGQTVPSNARLRKDEPLWQQVFSCTKHIDSQTVYDTCRSNL